MALCVHEQGVRSILKGSMQYCESQDMFSGHGASDHIKRMHLPLSISTKSQASAEASTIAKPKWLVVGMHPVLAAHKIRVIE